MFSIERQGTTGRERAQWRNESRQQSGVALLSLQGRRRPGLRAMGILPRRGSVGDFSASEA